MYGIIKAPPPFCIACTGNLKKFPNPTAFPAIASIRPTRDPQDSLFAIRVQNAIFQHENKVQAKII
jgi:hypothetical protein